MRKLQRALATAVAGLAFAAAGITAATPASATPEDGKGCVGTPAVPASYICVISLTPENVTPDVTTVIVPVKVPSICYFLDCTAETTVNVPVPNVTPKSGIVVTLWYQGVYYPIGVGSVDVNKLLWDSIDLATGVANTAVGLAVQLANFAIETAEREAGEAMETVDREVEEARETVDREVEAVRAEVQRIVDGLPTVDEIVEALVRYLEENVVPIARELVYQVRDAIDRLREWDPTQEPIVEDVMERVRDAIDAVENCLRVCIGTMDIPPILEPIEITPIEIS